MPVLPLKDATLIYGSEDAGKTVHNEDGKFYEALRGAASFLNLAEHKVRDVNLCTGGDVEGHYHQSRGCYCAKF